MPRYKVKTRSFINDQLVEEGQEIEFAGEPGEHLEPLDDAAKAAAKAAQKRRADKAAAIVVGASAHASEQHVATVSALIDRVAAAEKSVADLTARVVAAEAAAAASGPAPDLSGFAKAADVAELDAGLQIVDGRLSEVEGTLSELAKGKPETDPATG